MELQATGIYLERSAVSVLNNISVSFKTQGSYALIGPNGAGKTSLLKCLAGSIQPQQGQAKLGDRPIKSWATSELKTQIAYLPQHISTPFSYSVREYISLSGASMDTINRIIDDLELTEKASSSLQKLSGGERQRASLARVFAQQSQFVLLDEPFTHLDHRHQLQLLKYLDQRVRAGQTIIAVVHDLVIARAHFKNLCLLSNGQLIATGSPELVLRPELLSSIFAIQWDSRGHLASLDTGV